MVFKTLVATCVALVLGVHAPAAQDCDSQGLVEAVGVGTPGSFGIPLLSHVGVPLEDKAFWLEVSGGAPDARALLVASMLEVGSSLPHFDATLYPGPPLSISYLELDAAGDSPPLFKLPTVPDLCGREFVAQVLVLDAGAQGGAAFTRAMRVRFAGPFEGALFPLPCHWVGWAPRDISIGDLDGDGVNDVVVTNVSAYQETDRLSVLLGAGDGTFASNGAIDLGEGVGDHLLRDVDGDGVLDLVLALGSTDRVMIRLGHGNGRFVEGDSYPVGESPTALAFADLNGDHLGDLVVANTDSGDLSVLLGRGHGKFSDELRFGDLDEPNGVATGDFDGDGFPDLAVSHWDGYPSSDLGATVYRGLGDGSFGSPLQLDTGSPAESLATAELDGDGHLDLVVSHYYGLTVFLGLGDGSFAPPQHDGQQGDLGWVKVADMNGDGVLDLVKTHFGDGLVQVFEGAGDGTFPSVYEFPVGGGPTAVSAGDLDGNGVPDLVVLNDVLIPLLNPLVDEPAFPTRYEVDNPTWVAPADFNGDGFIDLAVTSDHAGVGPLEVVEVLLNRGDGTFSGPVPFAVGKDPVQVEAVDLDGDGALDLVVLNSHLFSLGSSSFSILMGHGDGTFAPQQQYPSAVLKPRYLATGDFDLDGVVDLAVSNAVVSAAVAVMLGNGDGTFGAATVFDLGSVTGLEAVDVSGDGVLDLISADQSSGVRVMLGAGDGTFSFSGFMTPALYTHRVDSGDVNGDGIVDLLLFTGSYSGIDSLAVMLGRGYGIYSDPVQHPVCEDPGKLAIADFDGDSRIDVATTCSGVSLLLGTGGGGFVTGPSFASQSEFVATADLDGDGDSDVIVLTDYDDLVEVFLNQLLE